MPAAHPHRRRSGREAAREHKRPFRFGVALPRIRRTLQVESRADAAMFEVADRGRRSVFEPLVVCILSIRTLDEVSLPARPRFCFRAHVARSTVRRHTSGCRLARGVTRAPPSRRHARARFDREVPRGPVARRSAPPIGMPSDALTRPAGSTRRIVDDAPRRPVRHATARPGEAYPTERPRHRRSGLLRNTCCGQHRVGEPGRGWHRAAEFRA